MDNIEFKIGDEVEIIPVSKSYSKVIGNITKQIDKDVFEVEYTTSDGITRTDRYYSQDLKPTQETKVLESLKRVMNEGYPRSEYQLTIKGTFKCKLKFPDGTIKEENVKLFGKTIDTGYYDSNIYGVDPENAVGGYELDQKEDFNPEDFEIDDDRLYSSDYFDDVEILEIIEPIDYEIEDVEPYDDGYYPED